MRSVILVLVLLLLAALACSLSSGDEATAVPIIRTPTLTLTPFSNLTPSPTSPLNATPTQSTSSSGAQPPANLPPTVTNCTPRTDWQIYTVQAGDTLSVIAELTSSTIADLAQANCLPNPDSLFVGQQLRVPQVPGGGTGSTTTGSTTGGSTTSGSTTGSTTSGGTTSGSTTGGTTSGGTSSGAPTLTSSLIARPVIQVDNVGIVTLQATIALDVGVVQDADRVRYYVGVTANDASPVNIATDVDPFDGTQINYTFNEFDDTLYFWAVAENEFGTTRSGTLKITYDPTYDPNAGSGNGAVSVTPFVGFDGSIYTLQYLETVTISWSSAPTDATRVDFYLTPSGTDAAPVRIGSDTNPGDGASMTWTVPQWVLGQLSATAFFPDGRTQDSLTINVYSEGEGVRPSN